MRNETFAKPVAQMCGLFTLYHFSYDGHIVTLFECDTRGGEIDIHFVHLVLRKGGGLTFISFSFFCGGNVTAIVPR